MKQLFFRRWMGWVVWSGLIAVVGGVSGQARTDGSPRLGGFDSRKYTFTVQKARLKVLLETIADKAKLELVLGQGVDGTISFSIQDRTLADALDEIANQVGLVYRIEGRTLLVERSGSASSVPAAGVMRQPGSVGTVPAGPVGPVRSIPLQFTTTAAVMPNLKLLIQREELLLAEETNNTLLFQGTDAGYAKLLEALQVLDKLPQQVLIDAQVVETNKYFMENMGVQYGVNTKAGRISASLPGPQMGNLSAGASLGILPEVTLNAKLSAAESTGDAKVVSRPKIVTLNNTAAQINSGVSLFVKTQTPFFAVTDPSIGTGQGGAAGARAGAAGQMMGGQGMGVQQLRAGFQLNVTPTIMGRELIRLKVSIDNSQPDESTVVDGIPGIVSNAANTSIIVTQGRTAVIAGLVKNSRSHSENSVPFLSKIPVLSWFFSNSADSDRNNELVIFITPHIVVPENDLRPMGEVSGI